MLLQIFKRFNVISAAGTALVGALVALALLFAPQAAQATVATPQKLTTSHWKQGSTHGYSITASVKVPADKAWFADMTISGGHLQGAVPLTEDSSGTIYSVTTDLTGRPALGETYTVNITYYDNPDTPTPPETLTFTVGAVLDSFPTPVSPLGGVASLSNPTFTWSASGSGSVAGYRLAIYGLNDDPWLSAQTAAGTLSAQYLPTAAEKTAGYPASLTAGTSYPWSVYVFDAYGNSAENRDGTVMIGASLAGKVTDFSNIAIGDVSVSVWNSAGGYVVSTTTGTDGSYLIGGLSTNTVGYKITFTKFINGVQQTTYYNNRLDDSDLLPFTAGILKSNIDAVLGGWGAILGKVVNSSSSPVSGITVQLLDANGNATGYPNATTKGDGTFSFNLLPPATYKVKAIGTSGVYVDALYGDSITGDPITVTAGQFYELSKNIMLGRVNITGTVTNTSGVAVPGVWVYLLNPNTGAWASNGVQTDVNGNYAISTGGVGSYRVYFSPVGGTYAKQYYDRQASFAAAKTITTSSTTVLAGINAVLGSGVPTITEFTVPATSSSRTVSGITFTASEPVYGVAGYMITESATAPLSTDAGWKSTAPTSYTVSGVGDITLYAWVKGATGLVSDSIARSVTVDASNVTPGDSDGDGTITIPEVKLAIDMYLGIKPSAQFVDTDKSDSVSLIEVQKVIETFLAQP